MAGDPDARDDTPAELAVEGGETLPRIEEPEGGTLAPALLDWRLRLGTGRMGFTTKPLAAMTMSRRMADSAGRSTLSTAL
jgi:hypothetical protein